MSYIAYLPNKRNIYLEDKRNKVKATFCKNCQKILDKEKFQNHLYVCYHCDFYHLMPLQERIKNLFDDFEEKDQDLKTSNPLSFIDYDLRLNQSYEKFKRFDSAVRGIGRIGNQRISACCLDFSYLGGSMGTIMGEKIARTFELSLKEKIPAFILNASGGARMQEGLFSLMQMGKISVVRSQLRQEKIFYLSLLTHPTTGGVAASFAFQGDLIIAEPKALIGFAGPRVIEQSLKQKLPEGFQRSEFLLEKGLIDKIVERKNLKKFLTYSFEFFSSKFD